MTKKAQGKNVANVDDNNSDNSSAAEKAALDIQNEKDSIESEKAAIEAEKAALAEEREALEVEKAKQSEDKAKTDEPTSNEPVLYVALEKSFINNRIVDAGQKVRYSGKPGSKLAPFDQKLADEIKADQEGDDKED